MGSVKTFEDLVVWQESKKSCREIYGLFAGCRDYAFRDQIQRAAISVMNNIAEGFERGGNKEFRHFLFIAKGSSGEVRSMLMLAADLNYLQQEEADWPIAQSLSISKMLSALIKRLA